MTDRSSNQPMEFDMAMSLVLNRPLQPSSSVNMRPQSNFTRIVQCCEGRLTAMEEQVRKANEQAEGQRADLRTSQDRLLARLTELQSHLLTVVNGKYEETIKKGMEETKKRSAECQARADDLEYDMDNTSRNFKKFAERLNALECSIGLYSGKDRLI